MERAPRPESIYAGNKEVGPQTKFGTALCKFADWWDNLAEKETKFTPSAGWAALGIEAVFGAVAIASVGMRNIVNSKEMMINIMEGMKYSGIVTGSGESWAVDWIVRMKEGVLRADGGQGFSGYAGYDMGVGRFARMLIEGGFKDEAGKSLFFLNPEITGGIVKLLDKLRNLEDIKCGLTAIFSLGAVGSLVRAGLLAIREDNDKIDGKEVKKLKVSAPIGRFSAVLPTIASGIREIGDLF